MLRPEQVMVPETLVPESPVAEPHSVGEDRFAKDDRKTRTVVTLRRSVAEYETLIDEVLIKEVAVEPLDVGGVESFTLRTADEDVVDADTLSIVAVTTTR